jgi:cobyrinic acid a,c-diamide synthase
MAHLMISAARMSTGKTTLAAGIGAALVARGRTVQAFKKGPDYIDPMWLASATGRPCYNLDFHTMSEAEIVDGFARHGSGADIAMIEGNMGLFDGVDLAGADSNAALAALLKAPVVLVLDASGMTRGVAPLILGYQAFDPTIAIAGVVLNKVGGERHESKLRQVIEHYTDVAVIGAVHRHPALEISERHLGLITSGEEKDAGKMIAGISDVVSEQVDLDCILDIAATAPLLSPTSMSPKSNGRPHTPDVRIAIARDSAFSFYYADDLEALRSAGAILVPFDTMADTRLPEADGLFIGGGFPECHLSALEANGALRGEIRTAIEGGMPAYAECGGLAYLTRSLSWRGETYEMVGVVPADAVMHERPQGRGYMRLRETGNGLWPAGDGGPTEIAAHEFHYAGLENISGAPVYAYDVLRGTGIDHYHDGIVYKNLLAGFSHRRNVAVDPWAGRFVEFVRGCKAS